MRFALVAYPLSGEFRERFEEAVGGPVTYVSVPELRRMSAGDIMRRLRSFNGAACYLPLEDEGSYAILPLLGAVGAMTNARSIDIVHADLRVERLPRRHALASAGRVAGASLDGRRAVRACSCELGQLLAAPAHRAPFGSGRRLLYLNGNLWFGLKAGGSVGHIAGVVNGLSRGGYEVELATATDPILVDRAVEVRRLQPPTAFGLPVELNYYRFQRSIVRQLRGAARPAFLYQRMSVANYAGAVLAAHMEIPLVLEYNGSEVWTAANWGRPLRYQTEALRAEEASLRHAQLVVTVSEVLADELVARGVDEHRVVWYPNGVDPRLFDRDRFDPAERERTRAQFGIPPDAVVAAFLGTFGQWHGVDVLARAIHELASEDADWLRQSQTRFLLIGDGLKMPEVRRQLQNAGSEFTTLAGLVPQEEAPRYLAAADILVSPHVPNADGSRFFGSPTKLFEYMACGLPILASRLDQLADVLSPAVSADDALDHDPPAWDPHVAMLAKPGDTDALKRGIRTLVERPQWRIHLGARARERVLARYTWDRHVRALLDAVDRVRQTDG